MRGNLRHVLIAGFLIAMATSITGCVPAVGGNSAASKQANAVADEVAYKPVVYANAARKGPTVIVLSGKIKSSNATFTQQVTANNIADFAELELASANFGVLERFDLGPMIDEISLAVGMGDPTALKKFRRGKFKSTKWFVRFDILKAEQVAKASSGFSGGAIGSIFGAVVGGVGGSVGNTAISSTHSGTSAGVWLVGLRYKLIDASTSEQVATGYIEKKMETGQKNQGFLGVSGSSENLITLDSIVQRLVQEAVVEIDLKK